MLRAGTALSLLRIASLVSDQPGRVIVPGSRCRLLIRMAYGNYLEEVGSVTCNDDETEFVIIRGPACGIARKASSAREAVTAIEDLFSVEAIRRCRDRNRS